MARDGHVCGKKELKPKAKISAGNPKKKAQLRKKCGVSFLVSVSSHLVKLRFGK